MVEVLKFNRVRRTYLGGENINKMQGIHPNEKLNYPESWIASTVGTYQSGKEGLSLTKSDRYLVDVISENPETWMGIKTNNKHQKSPILLKLLDSSERLVIQAHPTAQFARKHFNSDFGKTECWYFLDSTEDAHVYLGFKKGITKQKWKKLFELQDTIRMLDCLHKIPVKAGDIFFVDGGVPHAIGAGCFLVELQEPTDLMVVSEKTTPSGRKIPEERVHGGLGFERMFDCFDYTGYTEAELLDKYKITPRKKSGGITELIYNDVTDKFTMKRVDITGAFEYSFENCAAVLILEGSGIIKDANGIYSVSKGTELFVGINTFVEIQGELSMVICQPGRVGA